MTTPTLLTLHEVAAQLDVSSSTIRRWTATAHFPAPMRLGPRLLRWDAESVTWWLNNHRPRGIVTGANDTHSRVQTITRHA